MAAQYYTPIPSPTAEVVFVSHRYPTKERPIHPSHYIFLDDNGKPHDIYMGYSPETNTLAVHLPE